MKLFTFNIFRVLETKSGPVETAMEYSVVAADYDTAVAEVHRLMPNCKSCYISVN